jgi:hypothetical protein
LGISQSGQFQGSFALVVGKSTRPSRFASSAPPPNHLGPVFSCEKALNIKKCKYCKTRRPRSRLVLSVTNLVPSATNLVLSVTNLVLSVTNLVLSVTNLFLSVTNLVLSVTNLVYDNIDFGEEISKQTHVTNGIIIQRKSVQKQISPSDEPSLIKNTQRTVAMPTTDIAPYNIGIKKTPKFQSVELDPESLKLNVSGDSAERAYKLDLTYVLIKHICAATEEVLPGWAGFNTLLCKEIPDQMYLELVICPISMHRQLSIQPSTQFWKEAKKLLIN